MVQIEEVESGYLVSIPLTGGKVLFLFEEVEQPKSKEINADVTTWREVAGESVEPFSARLNILSMSNREVYRRNLDAAFGKEYPWTNLLNRACHLLRNAWQNKDWSVDLVGLEADTLTRYLVAPYLPLGLPSILFGPGGIGKTYLALSLVQAILGGGQWLGSDCEHIGPIVFVDFEGTERDAKKRLLKLGVTDFPGVVYWPGRGKPLAEMVPALSRKIHSIGAVLLIVDSAVLACGGDPRDEAVATGYFNGLAKIGITSLTISHMTKDEKDDTHPFGSVYWHLSARATWNLKASEDEGGDVKHLGLFPRKANEDRMPQPVGVRMSFDNGSVIVEREAMDNDLSAALTLKTRIRKLLLSQGKRSLKELQDETGAKPASLRQALRRMSDAFHDGDASDGSGYWMLAAER